MAVPVTVVASGAVTEFNPKAELGSTKRLDAGYEPGSLGAQV
jgi:hypothetical protein